MNGMTRRHFLAGSVGTALGVGGLRAAPSEQVVVAVVGANGMGNFHVRTLSRRSDVRIAYLCDVDDNVAGRVGKEVEKATGKMPRLLRDFRRVLEDKAVDALVIATPHHWHCPIAVRALQAGKDVYVEKPASHVFREGRLLVEAAAKYKRVVQHGTQMRSSEVTAEAGKVLASGILGEVKTTKAWNVQRQTMPRPRPDGPVPAGVDYDRWLGPAPKRAFNRNRFHRTWRVYRDYGNGDIGDDGAHDLDMARWGLGVTTHPVKITAHGSRIDLKGEREYPDNMVVIYQYGDGKVLIYEDRQWTPYGLHGFDSGNAFYGTKGYMIFSRRGYFQVYLGKEEKKGPGMGKRGRVGQPAPEHLANFLDCVRSRKQPNAPAEVAHLSCGLIHLGEIAYRTGKVLHFDPEGERFRGAPEADALLTKEYRKPWAVPDPV
jgi:predicted dehydrogenase